MRGELGQVIDGAGAHGHGYGFVLLQGGFQLHPQKTIFGAYKSGERKINGSRNGMFRGAETVGDRRARDAHTRLVFESATITAWRLPN